MAPGDSPSPGILGTGNLALSSTASFNVALNGTTPGAQYSQANATGSINLDSDSGGGAVLNLSVGYTPTIGDQFVIVNNRTGAPISGTFAGDPEGSTVATISGFNYVITYVGAAGTTTNDVVLTAESAAPSITGVTMNGYRDGQVGNLPSTITTAGDAFDSTQGTLYQGVDTGNSPLGGPNVVGQLSMVTDVEVTFSPL